ncbi:general secretion pathway protein GspC [Fluoribacter gormanii]|uniref:General secretion pathway protein C n=1 Tax=Fluoribacter gormanii TaxID=464 RepID=A0A377GH44_9GAMM|nr:type II secretion system protein N [Fluoribacter gormanii]KTD02146.1 general secretion pathway protein C [Fluoribacter gormanii]MCW8444331.1 general secretion pathway protein GspC [Fluoribacter gormanii]MCW8469522.1 general secretion pathway protein GspC [Fluoribacter gormanii]SIR51360.1 general secretion pathway protein C [Fluoribacter gormanii]STO24149.1 type II secretion system protein C [Fluoribacter gormanii]
MKFDIHALFSAKYAQWIIIALISLFSILIITEYATLLFSPVHIETDLETTNEMPVISNQNSFDAILHSSLFGVYVSDNLSTIKKSMLNVTLVGILFANQINDSQVIIRSADGEENTYKLGDTIPGGAVIKRIMASGILVERNGALESLSLPKNELIFEPVAKPLEGE